MKLAIEDVRAEDHRPTEENVAAKIRPDSIAARTLRDWLEGGPSFTELVKSVDAIRAGHVRRRDRSGLTELTQREVEVRGLLAQRMTNRQIAKELRLSVKTIENHVYSVLRKLGVNSRRQVTEGDVGIPPPPLRSLERLRRGANHDSMRRAGDLIAGRSAL